MFVIRVVASLSLVGAIAVTNAQLSLLPPADTPKSQNTILPECAKTCVESAAAAVGCPGTIAMRDPACVCKSSNFLNKTFLCTRTSCQNVPNQRTVGDVLKALCFGATAGTPADSTDTNTITSIPLIPTPTPTGVVVISRLPPLPSTTESNSLLSITTVVTSPIISLTGPTASTIITSLTSTSSSQITSTTAVFKTPLPAIIPVNESLGNSTALIVATSMEAPTLPRTTSSSRITSTTAVFQTPLPTIIPVNKSLGNSTALIVATSMEASTLPRTTTSAAWDRKSISGQLIIMISMWTLIKMTKVWLL